MAVEDNITEGAISSEKAAPTENEKRKEVCSRAEAVDIEDDLESKIQAFSIPVGGFAMSKKPHKEDDVEDSPSKETLNSQKRKRSKQPSKGKNGPEKKMEQQPGSKTTTLPKEVEEVFKPPPPVGDVSASRRSARIYLRKQALKTTKLRRIRYESPFSTTRVPLRNQRKELQTSVEKEKRGRTANKDKTEVSLSSSKRHDANQKEEPDLSKKRAGKQKEEPRSSEKYSANQKVEVTRSRKRAANKEEEPVTLKKRALNQKEEVASSKKCSSNQKEELMSLKKCSSNQKGALVSSKKHSTDHEPQLMSSKRHAASRKEEPITTKKLAANQKEEPMFSKKLSANQKEKRVTAKRGRRAVQKSKEAGDSTAKENDNNIKQRKLPEKEKEVNTEELPEKQEQVIASLRKSLKARLDFTSGENENASDLTKDVPSLQNSYEPKSQTKNKEISGSNNVKKPDSTAEFGKKVRLRDDNQVIEGKISKFKRPEVDQSKSSSHDSRQRFITNPVKKVAVEKRIVHTLSKKSDVNEALMENLDNSTPIFRELYNKSENIKLPSKAWSKHKDPRGAFLTFIHISNMSCTTNFVVAKSVTLRQSGKPILFLYGREANLYEVVSEVQSIEALRLFLMRVDKFILCNGVTSKSGSGRSENCELYTDKCYLTNFVCKHCIYLQKCNDLREDCEGVEFIT